MEQICPCRSLQKWRNNQRKSVIFCAICEVDWANKVPDKKKCWQTFDGSTGNMGKHVNDRHKKDARAGQVGAAERAG